MRCRRNSVTRLRKLAVALGGALSLWLGLSAGTAPAAAATAGVISVPPPTGLSLRPGDISEHGEPYGPTTPHDEANWLVGQWDIPEPLPPFGPDGVARNRWATVSIQDGAISFVMNGDGLDCTRHFPSGRTLPDEWAMTAGPNLKPAPGMPVGFGVVDTPLSQLRAIQLKTTLALRSLKLLDQKCKLTKAFFVTAAVLVDRSAHQTLFYGCGTFLIARDGKLRAIAKSRSQGGGRMYFSGENRQSGKRNVFGYSDPIDTAYNAPEIAPGQTQSYNIDLLPRIISVIKAGAENGMDQDLSHWTFRGYYEGQTVAGHVQLDAQWSGFQLLLVKN